MLRTPTAPTYAGSLAAALGGSARRASGLDGPVLDRGELQVLASVVDDLTLAPGSVLAAPRTSLAAVVDGSTRRRPDGSLVAGDRVRVLVLGLRELRALETDAPRVAAALRAASERTWAAPSPCSLREASPRPRTPVLVRLRVGLQRGS